MASGYVKTKHDIGLTVGSTTTGFMLRKGTNVLPQYHIFDDEYLAQQFFTGEPGYANMPPEKELAIRQDDWRSGLALEIYDQEDTRRYHKSTMDLRKRGQAIAGVKSTTVTKPTGIASAATLTNKDMELDANWTSGWRSSAFAHGGTWSWLVAGSGSDTYQDAATWDNSWRSLPFSVACWVYNNGVGSGSCRIGINDGISTTWSTTAPLSGSWIKLSVTKTLAGTATRLRVLLSNLDATESAYFDDAEIGSPVDGVAVRFINFNSALYMASGTILSKLNGAGTAFTTVMGLPATITALETFTVSNADYLFIAIGLSGAYWYMTTAEAFTSSNATVFKFKYFRKVNAASPTMWGSDSANTIRSTVNPLNGGTAWSGQTIVDAVYEAITGLHTDSGSLYISKQDTMYYLDSTGAVQNDFAPELTTITRSADNGKNTISWLSKLYMPWGRALLENNAGTNTWRNPSDAIVNASEYSGQIFALAGDETYLYLIVDNSTKIEVLVAREEVLDNQVVWVFHCINETTLTGCETVFISTVYQKRLWIASTSSSDSIYYIPLPLSYADLPSDTNRDFLTATTFETPWLHGNFRSTMKAFPKLELTMGHTYNADIYFTVKYKKLGDSSWTSIGNYTGSATSMTETKYLPDDASSNHPKSSMMKLQFTAVTDDTTITPILLNYTLTAILFPTRRDIIACKVYCANEIQLKDGTLDKASYETIVAQLDAAKASTWFLTLYDLDGTSINVKLLPLPNDVPWVSVIGNERDRKFEKEFNLLMMKVPLA